MAKLRSPKTNRVMQGTTAIHLLGDISRPKGDWCVVGRKSVDGNYVGNWITGFGFAEVKFPITTTRTLTQAERYKLSKLKFGIL